MTNLETEDLETRFLGLSLLISDLSREVELLGLLLAKFLNTDVEKFRRAYRLGRRQLASPPRRTLGPEPGTPERVAFGLGAQHAAELEESRSSSIP